MAKIQTNMKNIMIGLAAFIVIYFAWWFYNNLQQVEKKIEPIETTEARMQPYLALSEFLKSKHYTVKQNMSWARLDEVNPDDTVVVIPFLPEHLPTATA